MTKKDANGEGATPKVTLTAKQQEIVAFPASGDLLVKGIPGSGKTLTIVARAARLAGVPVLGRDRTVPLVRIFTYNKLLTEWIKFLSAQLGEDAPEITTFNSWASGAIRALGFTASVDYDDQAAKLFALAEAKGGLPPASRAHHVLVDEAQDLWADALKVIKMSAITSFTVAADKAQSIYATDFTWKSIGINVRGSRVRSLERSMRSTKQIARLATALARHDKALEKDDLISDFTDLRDGPKPDIYFCRTYAAADKAVRDTIALARAENPNGTIAILHANRHVTYAIAHAFGGRILDRTKPDMVTPGVLVATIHATKGLEFDTVIVKDVNEGVLPAADRDNGDASILGGETARRLLYVACMRAKRRLAIVAGANPSSLIDELEDSDYRRIDA